MADCSCDNTGVIIGALAIIGLFGFLGYLIWMQGQGAVPINLSEVEKMSRKI